MSILDSSALLKKQVLQVEKVDLGDGDFVFVREMTGRDRDNFEQSLTTAKRDVKGVVIGYEQALGDFRAKLAVLTLCDAAGELLLTPADISALSQNMSIRRLEKIVEASQKLNKITEEDKEDLVKNSNAGQPSDSLSDSVEN